MKSLKPFILFQILLIIAFLGPDHSHALIVLAPIAIGIVKLTLIVIGFSTLPVTFLSAIINLEKLKKSKSKFILVTIVTWLILISIIGGVTYLVLNYFDISIPIKG